MTPINKLDSYIYKTSDKKSRIYGVGVQIEKKNLNFVEQLLENAKQILNKKNLGNPISSKYDYIEVVN